MSSTGPRRHWKYGRDERPEAAKAMEQVCAVRVARYGRVRVVLHGPTHGEISRVAAIIERALEAEKPVVLEELPVPRDPRDRRAAISSLPPKEPTP